MRCSEPKGLIIWAPSSFWSGCLLPLCLPYCWREGLLGGEVVKWNGEGEKFLKFIFWQIEQFLVFLPGIFPE